jgi:predicted metal-dependent peptidase
MAPFFCHFLFPLKMQEAAIGTCATDGKSYLFNPEFVQALTDTELDFVTVHEGAHIALRHHLRGQGRTDWDRWNRAVDYAANDLLIKCGWKHLPKGVLIPGVGNELPRGLSAEEYDTLLAKQQEEQQAAQQEKADDKAPEGVGDTQAGDSDSKGTSGDDGADEGKPEDEQEGAGDEQNQAGGGDDPSDQHGDATDQSGTSGDGVGQGESDGDNDADPTGSEGGGNTDDADADAGDGADVAGCTETKDNSDGLPSAGGGGNDQSNMEGSASSQSAGASEGQEAGEAGAEDADSRLDGAGVEKPYVLPDPSQWGQIEKYDGEVTQQVMAEADAKVAQAAMICEEAGVLPHTIKEMVEALLKPSAVPWPQLLRRHLKQVARDGRSYRRPNRRYAGQEGALHPSRFSQGLGHVVLLNDVSASRDTEVCVKALEEVQAIVAKHPEGKVTVIQWDTVVQSVSTFTKRDFPIKLGDERVERKGAGGTDVTEAMRAAVKLHPDLILIATDGYLGGWPTRPAAPVIWLMSTDEVAPWGVTIRCHG